MSIPCGALLFIITVVLLGMWWRYPTCEPGHVAVSSLQFKTGWACVLGYDPSPRKERP